MKKYIEVIIKNPSHNQSKIQKVARGYAFNYLIPNNLAEFTTKGKIKHLKMLHNVSSEKQTLINELNKKIYNEIIQIEMIHIRKKYGKNYQIFGSVSEQDIYNKICKILSQRISKQQILITSMKQLGTYIGYIVINENLKAPIKLRILPHYL